ncbi:hypothetical protein V5799_007474 [Amblyomma americanum]|uniref:MAM domain-containing protein n=1 Tax=Amblyomma americanum TaxID=6943 RepID=A0AAQ4FHR2_AMBAM
MPYKPKEVQAFQTVPLKLSLAILILPCTFILSRQEFLKIFSLFVSETKNGSCDFDWGDACGYDLGIGAQKWLLEGSDRKEIFESDYSTNTKQGGLVYFRAKGNRSTSAALSSPMLSGRTDVQCLQFQYYLSRLVQAPEGVPVISAAVKGPQYFLAWARNAKELIRGDWTPVELAFKVEKDFQIEFRCNLVSKQYNWPYCAIDAIRLGDCKGNRAQQDGLCNFEDGWCSWKNNEGWRNRPAWQLGGGTVKTTLLRPLQDHTFGNATPAGSYLFFNNYLRRTGDQAELVGELLPQNTRITQCAEFWYIISGDKATKLEVLSIEPDQLLGKNTPLWGQKGGSSQTWMLGRVAVPNNKQVVFRGTVGPASTPAYIALDDIAIGHHDHCETFPLAAEALSAANLLSCNFYRLDFCHWMSLGLPSNVWAFGPFYSTELGPSSAPKNSKSGMVSITGARLVPAEGTVQLQSPVVGTQTEPSCFSVWYHMFGGRGSSLSLSIAKPDSVNTHMWSSSLLFIQRDRTTADRWHNVRRTMLFDGAHNKLTFVVTNAPFMRKGAVVALSSLVLTPGPCDILTDGEGYCDFEFDTCAWSAANGWRRQEEQSSSILGVGSSGPVNSVYFMTATQPASSPAGAEFSSPEWQGQTEPRCLEFWYRSEGKTGSELQVEVVVNGKSEVIWKKPSYQEPEWMLVRTQILQEKNFKVLFRAKFLNDPSQSVSLDDVVLRPEPCVHPAECDFSDGLCGYVNKFQEDFRWLVGPGRLESRWVHPDWPRVQGRSSSFAYLDLTTGKDNNDVSEASQRVKTVGLLSPLFHVTDDYTSLSLQYFRKGQDITTANLSVSCFGDSDKADVLIDRELGEVAGWTTVNVTLKRGTNCQLAVWVARGDGEKGSMAISAVQVTTSKEDLKPTPSSDSPTRCTFEEGTMCGWRATSMSLNWAINDPSKKLPDFPRFDHTVKAYKGRFLFASNKNNHLDTASLESPELEVHATNGACLSLWLFTVHASHNDFAVFVGRENVFHTNARASHRWEHVLVDIKKRAEKLKILIEANFGRGLVALDDIQLDAGSCPMRDFCSWEEGSPCLTIPAPGSFSFWQPRRAALFGFPDHTLKNLQGRYLYLNTTGVDSHHPVARVFLQTRPPTEATCVTFWWSGRGATSQLNVYRFTKETVLRDPLVSVSTADRPGYWIPRTITVSSRSNWNLVFEGVAAAGVKSDSAIMLDDVEFTDGECPPYNFCTFEDECLPWEIPSKGDEAAFEVERAGSFDKLRQDHTTQTADGYYLLFKSPGTEGNRTSMELREPLRYGCLSFWYYLPTLSDGVKLRLQHEGISVGKGVWKRHETPFPSQSEKPIVAKSGKNADGFVAIDDVLVNEEHCRQLTRTSAVIPCGEKDVPLHQICDFVPDCDDGADEQDCGECDFGEGSCGWDLDRSLNQFTNAWRRERIGDVPASPRTGAQGQRSGYYLLLYTNVTASRRPGRGTINSPRIRNTSKFCTLHFWYNYVHNGSSANVDLSMAVAGFEFPVWTLNALSETPDEGVWNEAIVDVGRYAGALNFVFTGSHYSQGNPMFAVDLITYDGCALPGKNHSITMCLYLWQVKRRTVRIFNSAAPTGPALDATLAATTWTTAETTAMNRTVATSGLAVTSTVPFVTGCPRHRRKEKRSGAWAQHHRSWQSRPREITQREPRKESFFFFVLPPQSTAATVIGHTLDNNSTCAITFFYTIQGQADSELKLAIRTTKDGPWKTVWKQSKPTQFFHFIQGMVVFTEHSPYQVAFIGEHKKSGNKQGYIAIDDVTFWESCKPYHEQLPLAPEPAPPSSSCGEEEFHCSGSSQCIPLSQVCDFKEHCSNGVDESRCDVPQSHATMLLTPQLGQTAHSCVVSFYVYIPNQVCTFESDSCGWQLHNWERTSGSSVILPQSDYSTQSPSGRFALALSPGGRMVSPQGWYDASRHKCLRFWFFISGSSAEALNVTRVSDGRDEESLWFATKAHAPVQHWLSAAVALVNKTKTANVVFEGLTSGDRGAAVAVDDISVGETACPSPGSCTFEEDMCNWYNSEGLSYAQWYRHKGSTVFNSTGIGKDHTLGTKDGFLYVGILAKNFMVNNGIFK